ncbi:carboxylating nicotinate-nucleotide diphosphorylase [soil metagenome]
MADPALQEPLADLVARALAEDVGPGDVTSEAVVPESAWAGARIVQKGSGVVFGIDVAAEVFRQAGACELRAIEPEGVWVDSVPVDVAVVEGPARALLVAERTALNLLGHLSGVATLAARYVRAANGAAVVLDTRKTTPGLRALEKAAVAAGGATNHRFGLYDLILIKENHVALAGGVGEAVRAARAAKPGLRVEIECRDADEVAAALQAKADILLLDNMSLDGLRDAVSARDAAADKSYRAQLEASGGVDLETIGPIAARGVDFVSVGALTHSAPALDLSMLMEPLQG